MSTATGWDDPTFWTRQQESADMILASDDAFEGATAFAEKRDPKWTGR